MYMIFLHALFFGCRGLLLNETMEKPNILSLYYHVTATFGIQSWSPEYVVSAPLVAVEPQDGCSNATNWAELEGAIGIVKRGDCLDFDKAWNVAAAGAVGMIVGNSEPNWLLKMTKAPGEDRDVNIPCVFITGWDYDAAIAKISDKPRGSVVATISSLGEYSIEHTWFTLSFPRIASYLLLIMLMIGGLVTVGRFCCRICARRPALKKAKGIPEVLYSIELVGGAGERKWNRRRMTDTKCSICLENFKEQERIKLLPCGHGFHSECIEPWIANHKDSCPICRQTVTDKLGVEYICCSCSISCCPHSRVVSEVDPEALGNQALEDLEDTSSGIDDPFFDL